jgi:uncharacterized protein (TIGR02302 family)
LEIVLLRLGRWKPVQPERTLDNDGIVNPRLERLVATARMLMLFERLWRVMVPPLVVLGCFVCISWTGLWLDAPHWARFLGLLVLALGLIIALLPLRKLRWPSRKEALDRIDLNSGLPWRPAAVINDRLGNGTNDPATLALWSLHRRRAQQAVAFLHTGGPSPRIVDLDRYALRAAVLVGLVATGFVAGPERYARIAAAFDWRIDALHGNKSRIDAWIDPPAYTGKPPVVLDLGGRQNATRRETVQQIEAPVGSIVVIHAPDGNLDFNAKGALEAVKGQGRGPQAASAVSNSAAAQSAGDNHFGNGEIRMVLRGDATLTLGNSGKHLATFDIHAILDDPPSIALTAPPKFNARGSVTLKYTVADDYGVTGAEADFAKPVLPGGHPSKRSLVDPPRIPLLLPPPPELSGEAETTSDLSEHPWAGARVEMTLTARDEAGNEGKSDAVEITLPQKPFVKPLARALAEQRRNLVLDPDDKARVATALNALMIAPETFGTSAGVYLGLRVAFDRLNAVQNDSDLVEVADYIWQMALRIESGDLSEAERDLRAAEQELREALQRGAPEEEIRKLSENLRAAMDKFLQELTAQENNEDHRDNFAGLEGKGRWISPKDLQRMLDEMQAMLRSGDSVNARKMLEQLQDILENLRLARPRKADPRAREMSRMLDELGQLGQDQQDLRDETYQSGQAERHRQHEERRQFGLPGQLTLGDIYGQGGDQDPIEGGFDKGESSPGKTGKSPADGQTASADLGKRQKALRERLKTLQKHLDESGASPDGLDAAQGAMRDAEGALAQGPHGTDSAVDAEGRAVEALRDAAQNLAENMQGDGRGSDDGEQQEGQGSSDSFGAADGSDPLGRPTGHDRGLNNPAARFDPMGAPAAERARRVLEELRRRLGEPARPQEELEYLERLLRRY